MIQSSHRRGMAAGLVGVISQPIRIQALFVLTKKQASGSCCIGSDEAYSAG